MPNQSPKLAAALAALDVTDRTLTAAEKAGLDRDGFVILHDLVPPGLIERMRRRILELQEEQAAAPGLDHKPEAGAIRVCHLLNKDALFDVTVTHPRVLAAIAHIIDGDFQLSSLTSRAAIPGAGRQGLHADWARGDRTPPTPNYVANSIWALDEFTEENGATRVVPGSHRWRTLPHRVCPAGDHPDQVPVLLPVGSVVVTNAYLWHAGSLNRTAQQRLGLHAFFNHVEESRAGQFLYLSPETYERLSEPAKTVLNADSCPSAPFWATIRQQQVAANV